MCNKQKLYSFIAKDAETPQLPAEERLNRVR